VITGASKVSKFDAVFGNALPIFIAISTLPLLNPEADELDIIAVLQRTDVAVTHMLLQAVDGDPAKYTVGDVLPVPKLVPSTVIVKPPLRAVLYTWTAVIDCALTLADAKSFKTTHRNSNLRAMPVSVAIVPRFTAMWMAHTSWAAWQ
jgi:hypothetical protein